MNSPNEENQFLENPEVEVEEEFDFLGDFLETLKQKGLDSPTPTKVKEKKKAPTVRAGGKPSEPVKPVVLPDPIPHILMNVYKRVDCTCGNSLIFLQKILVGYKLGTGEVFRDVQDENEPKIQQLKAANLVTNEIRTESVLKCGICMGEINV